MELNAFILRAEKILDSEKVHGLGGSIEILHRGPRPNRQKYT